MGRLRTRVERLERLPAPPPSGGTVTSVGVSTGSSGVSVTGSPVTSSGTIDLALGTAAAQPATAFDPAGAAATAEANANAYTDAEIAALTYVESVTAGTGVTVDNTDPQNPIISASGGGGATQINATLYRALGVLQTGDSATLNDAPACTLTGWRISSQTSGSISIDVRATTWPTQPGPSESLIGNSLYNIILSAETTHDETDLSNWASTTLSGGERLEFYVVSASGVGAVDITVSIA